MGYKISLELFKNKKNKKSYDELKSCRKLLGHPVLSNRKASKKIENKFTFTTINLN